MGTRRRSTSAWLGRGRTPWVPTLVTRLHLQDITLSQIVGRMFAVSCTEDEDEPRSWK